MKTWYSVAELSLNTISIMVASIDIENVLSIILLVLSVCSILYRLGYNIYKLIKNKKYDKIDDEIDKAKDDIEKLGHDKEDK